MARYRVLYRRETIEHGYMDVEAEQQDGAWDAAMESEPDAIVWDEFSGKTTYFRYAVMPLEVEEIE